MCDTIVAMPVSTAEGLLLFGKNSDRQRNEAHVVQQRPRADYEPHARLQCTYVEIPQARRTHAVLLCRPFWTWGAEMGANEHDVVIGNEAVSARSPAPEKEALTGMDLVRLGLERSTSADEAVAVITQLLQEHGQGGNCGHRTPAYYNNAFMIADPTQAFVLETIDRDWLVQRVQRTRAISNRYSINSDAHSTSVGLPEVIRKLAIAAPDRQGYAEVLADPDREHIGNAGARHARSTALLSARDGSLLTIDMMNILRDHGDARAPSGEWRTDCTVQRTLCMHAGADDRPGQTVGSMVSQVRRHGSVHWVTGTAAACASIFKPVLIDAPLPEIGPTPTDRFDARTLWWRHEQLHRTALRKDFSDFLQAIRAERDALEVSFQARINAVSDAGSVEPRRRAVAECWAEANAAEASWSRRMAGVARKTDTMYHRAWERMSEAASVDFTDSSGGHNDEGRVVS